MKTPFSPPITILVLDDEQGVLDALRSLLRREGYQLSLFRDAKAALEQLGRQPVDIIMSDLRMPGMSGIEFLGHAAEACPGAERIMVSGYEDREIILRSLAKGLAQHYVMKPWDDTELKDLTRLAAERSRALGTQKLVEVFGRMESIPAPPRQFGKLSSVLSQQEVPLRSLVEEIEQHPPVVVKLLQIANSIYYPSRQPVTTLREAIQFVGTAYLESLVTAIEAFQSVGGTTDRAILAQVDSLWQRALVRAGIAKCIGERWPGFQHRQVVFVASLLQDVGLVVRAVSNPEEFNAFLAATAGERPLLDLDQEIFGVTHDTLGAALLKYWNLPAIIVTAAEKHHQPGQTDPLLQIIQVADVLSGDRFAIVPDEPLKLLTDEWRWTLSQPVSQTA